MTKLTSVLIALLCSGCGIAPVKYVEPVAGPVATVHFKNASNLKLTVAFYETSKDCVGRQKADPPIPPQTSASHKVVADREVTFEYLLVDERPTTEGRHCLLNVRFLPRSGRVYSFVTGATHFGCKATMSDSTEPSNPQPVTLKFLPWDSKWGNGSAFCQG